MKIVDLTQRLSKAAKTYPTGPDGQPASAPRFEPSYLARLDTHGYNWMHYVMDSHAGTHVDAPYHFVEDGLRMADVPLERFINRALVLDASDGTLGAETIQAAHAQIRGRILLLYTGWPIGHQFGTDEYFQGFPTFGPEIGHAIVDAGALAVGVDTPSIDALDGDFENHNILLPQNIVLIENLTNVDQLLTAKEFMVCAPPLKIDQGDASPVRAYALVTE